MADITTKENVIDLPWMQRYDAGVKAQLTKMAGALQDIITDVGANVYAGTSRISDATDPDMTKNYGSRAALSYILSHMKIGAFQGSTLVAEMAPGRITQAVDGSAVAIDGSQGDILPYIDRDIYFLRNTGYIGGEKRSAVALGLVPYIVGDKMAKQIKPFAFSPNATVTTKLSGDTRACQHSIYNTSIKGYYAGAPAWYKQKLRTDGGGYPDTHVTAITAYTTAQDRNTDNSKTGDAKPLFHDFMAMWFAALFLEAGTTNFTRTDLFGTGCTNTAATAAQWDDEAISAVSGLKTITADGQTVRHYGICGQNMKTNASASAGYGTDGLSGSSDRYNFTEMLEMLRLLDAIKANNLTAYIGNHGNIFTDGGATVITDGSVNLTTGEGMTPGQKYYVVRNVPGCQGLADGVMTAVVNIYIKMECEDNVVNSNGDDLTGGCCIYKLSHGIYRGFDLLDGKYVSLAGTHYVFRNDNGAFSLDYYYCEDVEDLPLVRNVAADYHVDVDEENIPMLAGYKFGFNIATGDGWVKSARYDMSMWAYDMLGSSMHYGENAHIWKSYSYGCPGAVNSRPAANKKCVNASFAGCAASTANAGRTSRCYYAVSHSYDPYARGFAQTNLIL